MYELHIRFVSLELVKNAVLFENLKYPHVLAEHLRSTTDSGMRSSFHASTGNGFALARSHESGSINRRSFLALPIYVRVSRAGCILLL